MARPSLRRGEPAGGARVHCPPRRPPAASRRGGRGQTTASSSPKILEPFSVNLYFVGIMTFNRYTDHNLCPAYKLRYSWSGFPAKGSEFPGSPPPSLLSETRSFWAQDGLHLLEHSWSHSLIQLTFSTLPSVSPVHLAARAKGRLQHAMRMDDIAANFARNYSIRSLGENIRETVESYISDQVHKADLADPKYREGLQHCVVENHDLDLSTPTRTSSGVAWYDLHVVFVTADRFRIDSRSTAVKIRDASRRTAADNGYGLSRLSVMPDHMHMLVRGNPRESPQEISLSFQNRTEQAVGNFRLWQFGFYVGTVGDYSLKSIH
jgi:putative transposase